LAAKPLAAKPLAAKPLAHPSWVALALSPAQYSECNAAKIAEGQDQHQGVFEVLPKICE
jgi:hypothetical protein